MFNSPHVPKVVFDKNEKLLFTSRSPIPSNKKEDLSKHGDKYAFIHFPTNL